MTRILPLLAVSAALTLPLPALAESGGNAYGGARTGVEAQAETSATVETRERTGFFGRIKNWFSGNDSASSASSAGERGTADIDGYARPQAHTDTYIDTESGANADADIDIGAGVGADIDTEPSAGADSDATVEGETSAEGWSRADTSTDNDLDAAADAEIRTGGTVGADVRPLTGDEGGIGADIGIGAGAGSNTR